MLDTAILAVDNPDVTILLVLMVVVLMDWIREAPLTSNVYAGKTVLIPTLPLSLILTRSVEFVANARLVVKLGRYIPNPDNPANPYAGTPAIPPGDPSLARISALSTNPPFMLIAFVLTGLIFIRYDVSAFVPKALYPCATSVLVVSELVDTKSRATTKLVLSCCVTRDEVNVEGTNKVPEISAL